MLNISNDGYKNFLSDNDYEKLLNDGYYKSEILEGKVISSKFLYKDKNFVVVDIGFKSEGFISISEFSDFEINNLSENSNIDAIVEIKENDNNQIILSKEKANKIKIWNKIVESYEKDKILKGIIVSKVKGGFHIDIGIKAFLPGSQFDLKPIKDIDKYIGKEFEFKVIKFNKKRGNIVLSRRVLLEKERKEQRSKTLEKLKEGLIVEGFVKNLTDYGAFIDLGGLDGLLHVTDISWGRINTPSIFFKIGDKIKVKVLKFDSTHERVSLGIKQMKDNPWKNVYTDFTLNSKVSGKIVALTDYGCFVELSSGIEGLVHISEFFWSKKIKHPLKFLRLGNDIESSILTMDSDNRRISLGLKCVNFNYLKILELKILFGFIYNISIKKINPLFLILKLGFNILGLILFNEFFIFNKIEYNKKMFFKNIFFSFLLENNNLEDNKFFFSKSKNDLEILKFHLNEFILGKIIKIFDEFLYIYLGNSYLGICLLEFTESSKNIFTEGEIYNFYIFKINRNNLKIYLLLNKFSKEIIKGIEINYF